MNNNPLFVTCMSQILVYSCRDSVCLRITIVITKLFDITLLDRKLRHKVSGLSENLEFTKRFWLES